MGRVLTIAGSDPSGGAGIQADIKTITALGGYAAAAITTVTVQNTVEVSDVIPMTPQQVKAQVTAVLSDVGADAVKTGMVLNAGIIHAVSEALIETKFDGPLVVDPVMVASSGARLLDEEAVDALKSTLLPKATLLTPNIPEVEVLTHLKIEGADDMPVAAEALFDLGCSAVLLKGGHLDSRRIVDQLFVKGSEPLAIDGDKILTRHTHGTGCTTASAIATLLAAGKSLPEAFLGAHAFVRRAIELAPGYGAGHGPLGHALVGKL